MDKTVLVTGGAGYIGSHACKALNEKGYTPVTYDNLYTGNREAVKWGPLEEGDIRDEARLGAAMDKHKPFAVMHFAALIQVAESVAQPDKYYDNNVGGSLSLLKCARERDIANLVFSSTAAVYGMPDCAAIPEDHPLRPINPYGNTKLAMENMIRDFSSAYGMRHAILRYFNAAGADPEAESGTAYPKDTHIIPILMNVAAGEAEGFKIFGDDYATPDGTAVRDYIHVTDLADAHVLALEAIAAGGSSLTLNLGTSKGSSVQEILEAARRVTGEPIQAALNPRRPGDPDILVANADKAKNLLNWNPSRSNVEEILATAWKWRQKQAQFGKTGAFAK
ncbi:MAG: UDP-glucose 4-epimerase GalE [Alphaproteobacteria bacterium]|nr:UDP-glucose 4-epimerase GalE [Alphaproteobacteria bacterium]